MDKKDPGDSQVTILPHDSVNPEAEQTILLIHGAFTSRKDWDLVEPFLSTSYHLLIPDLPSHGAAKDIRPFSKPICVSYLATLIRKRAHNGRAHIIGHSLGAKVAIDLVCAHPNLVETVFISGYEVYPSLSTSSWLPYGVWTMNRIESLVPRPAIRWLMDGTDIQRTNLDTCTVQLCRDMCARMGSEGTGDEGWPKPWKARTLIVAAGKAGILPTADHPHDAVRLAKLGREANPETRAVTHPDMRHPWNRQAPELWARTARAWIEKTGLPEGFVDL